jgi:hypothetical protein
LVVKTIGVPPISISDEVLLTPQVGNALRAITGETVDHKIKVFVTLGIPVDILKSDTFPRLVDETKGHHYRPETQPRHQRGMGVG